ncbi:MAG: hypothetical protein A2007_01990 [Verrucomicrobia bacterium GWC2_42_7]|nr:MAG: hypothetical protein A2007_01990 [Verrucomicrobia bacterium GWC2_42_7]
MRKPFFSREKKKTYKKSRFPKKSHSARTKGYAFFRAKGLIFVTTFIAYAIFLIEFTVEA